MHGMRALGLLKKKGTASDFVRMIGGRQGVRVREKPGP